MDKKLAVYLCKGCDIGGALDMDALSEVATDERRLELPIGGLDYANLGTQPAENFVAWAGIGARLDEAGTPLGRQLGQRVRQHFGAPGTAADEHVEGQSRLLEDVKALEDLERARTLLAQLEEQQNMLDLLGTIDEARGVQIFIGTENKIFDQTGWSMVISPYKNAAEKIIGAIGVIVLRNPVHAALGLVLTLFGVAVQFVAQEAHFLAAIQVMVYAGAIMVLIIFVLMLLNIQELLKPHGARAAWFGPSTGDHGTAAWWYRV